MAIWAFFPFDFGRVIRAGAFVAAGVAQGSEIMKRIPGQRRNAESDLAGRMTEALPGRKVAQKKAGMLGGALQMNFRGGASPASPHQAIPRSPDLR